MASTTDVFNQSVGYNYDANGNRTALTLGGSANATYVYDVINRLTQLTDSGGLAFTYAYDATNKVTTRALPNGITTTYQYDGLDRLTRLRDTTAIATVADNQYSYNSASQITQNIDLGGAHNYGYDTVDRVTSATYPGTTAESFSYDGVGNRTTSHLSATYGYQPFNKLTSTTSATYSYDNNGNLISKTDGTGTTQYAWDFENRLKQVTLPNGKVVTYKYDALGRRIDRTATVAPPLPLTTTTRFIYDGQDVIRDTDGNGVTTADYLNGPGIDNKLRQTTPAAGALYFTTDHLGSTRALTNAAGVAIANITYDSFGNSSGSALTRYTYTGREFDSDAGILYYRARWYDPQLGRFISEDPARFDGDVNWYIYAKNDPIRSTDPLGLKLWVCSRAARGPFTVASANHSYLFDDRNGQACGLAGTPPNIYGSTASEKGPTDGGTCRPVDGSDDPIKADQIMNCCKGYKSRTYTPWRSDCHNLTHSCITGAGLKDPGAPGGGLVRDVLSVQTLP